MKKDELKEKFIKRYLNGDGVTEYEVLFEEETLFKQIIRQFGSWSKFEKEIGFLKRNIRERDKFYLYWQMKERRERFGDKALRHKNIEEGLKNKIQEEFGAVKYLTDNLIKNREKEAIIYETHAYVLSGGNPNNIKEENVQLYAEIVSEFMDTEQFFKEYEKSFLINPTSSKDNEEKQDTSLKFDVDQLLKMGYLTEEQAEELRKKNIEKQRKKA